jgi:hypothetical protein
MPTTAPEISLSVTVSFPNTPEYVALSSQLKADYVRNDAAAHGYAWGRLDQGHVPVVALTPNEAPSTTATAWVFGSLYAKMLLELHDSHHARSSALSMPSAWDVFVQTGCPTGSLPQRLGA